MYYILIFLMFAGSNNLFQWSDRSHLKRLVSKECLGKSSSFFLALLKLHKLNQIFVQSALDQLDFFLSTLNKESVLCKELTVLRERFIQPEELIRSETSSS